MAAQDLIQDPNFTTPDGTPLAALARNPHVQSDLVHGSIAETSATTVLLELFDVYGENTTQVEHVADLTLQSAALYGNLTLDPSGQGIVMGPTLVGEIARFDITLTGLKIGETVYVYDSYYSAPSSNPLRFFVGIEALEITQPAGTQMSFVATDVTQIIQVSLLEPHDAIEVYGISAQTITYANTVCHPFVRKIEGASITDFEADGVTPYTVIGTISESCPNSGCDCGPQFDALQQELIDIKALVQQLLDAQPPVQTMVNTGQPSLRLSAGTYTKAQILALLNTEHYNGLVDTNAGIYGFYGLNSIVLAPSTTFDLSIAGATSQNYDYPISIEANKNTYLLEDTDDFTVIVPVGETLDVHMVVWLTGIAA